MMATLFFWSLPKSAVEGRNCEVRIAAETH
jgi:hypothetical protein